MSKHAKPLLRSIGIRFLAAAAFLLITITAPAFAIPVTIGGPDCSTCQGATYTLDYGSPLPDSDPLHETIRITLAIDTSGVAAFNSDIAGLADVVIKASSSVFGASLVTAPGDPDDSNPAVWSDDWKLYSGGTSGKGCSEAGAGFECAAWVGGVGGAPIGGTLEFAFDLTVDNGALYSGLDGASIKARYVDASGTKAGGLLSESVVRLPEPSTLLVFGPGLAMLTGMLCRRRRRG